MNFFDDVLGSSGWPSYGRRSPYVNPYSNPYAPRTVNRPVSHPNRRDFNTPARGFNRFPPSGRASPVIDPKAQSLREFPVSGPPRREEGPQPKATRVIPVTGPPSPRKPNKYAENHDGAALKIQSVYRGYSVRRTTPLVHLRKVSEVKTKLAGYKEKVSDAEKVRFIRENQKEQLALSEGVMKLLLQLDDIQGALPVVREIRKAAVKDAVQFLEKVDSLLKGQERAAEENVAEERATEDEQMVDEQAEKGNGSVDIDTSAYQTVEDGQTGKVDGIEESEVVGQTGNGSVDMDPSASHTVEDGQTEKVDRIEESEMAEEKGQTEEGNGSIDTSASQTVEDRQTEKVDRTEESEMVTEKGNESDNVVTEEHTENVEGHREEDELLEEERTEGCKEEVQEQTEDEMHEAEEDLDSDNEEMFEAIEEQGEPMMEDTEKGADELKGEDKGSNELKGVNKDTEDPEEETKRIVHTMVEDAVNNVRRKREREEAEEAARIDGIDKLVKKLLDDNAQLKTLVAQCIKQNEIQSAMICMLNDRVQKLEKKAKKSSTKKKEQL